MGDEHRFESFEDFWPYYVKEHSQPLTRAVHVAGTLTALACLSGALLTRRRWLAAAAPVVGYGAAWASHFVVEKNRPATFKHPLWSLRGDLRMLRLTLLGGMDDEVARATAAATPPAGESGARPDRPGNGKSDADHGHARAEESAPSSRLDVN